jgi:LysR family transcriptional regulator, chromosome initiation inhibitor
MSLLNPNLEAFLAIVNASTVQSAAKIIGLSQTGVTQRIRALESQLSTTLFIRSRRGMQLTREGEALLRYCLSAKDLEGEALSKISGAGSTSEIRVVIQGPTSIMRTRVAPQCLSLLKDFPQLSMNFLIDDNQTGAENLRSGKVQFAILPPQDVALEMDSKLIKSEMYVLVAAKSWKNRKLEEIVQNEKIIDFDTTDQTTYNYLKKFRLHSKAKNNRHLVNNNELLLMMLENELGYGVLTQEFAENYLKQSKITILNKGQQLENRLALAWYPRTNMPSYFKQIVQSIH